MEPRPHKGTSVSFLVGLKGATLGESRTFTFNVNLGACDPPPKKGGENFTRVHLNCRKTPPVFSEGGLARPHRRGRPVICLTEAASTQHGRFLRRPQITGNGALSRRKPWNERFSGSTDQTCCPQGQPRLPTQARPAHVPQR